jgi:hypothetical protein
MTLAEFMDVDFSEEVEGQLPSSLFNKSVVEAENTIRNNYSCGKKEAKQYAKEFTESLKRDGRLTEDFVASEPFYWKVLHDFTQ